MMRNIELPTSNSQHRTPKEEMRKNTRRDIEHYQMNPEAGTALALNEENENRKYDLEKRLLEFAWAVIDLSERLPNTRAGNHVAGQVLRSGTAPYSNHGEAESAESRDDFIHKLSVCLKELRETRRWTRLIHRKGWATNDAALPLVLGEGEELIRIFVASIKTAKLNNLNQRRRPTAGTRYAS